MENLALQVEFLLAFEFRHADTELIVLALLLEAPLCQPKPDASPIVQVKVSDDYEEEETTVTGNNTNHYETEGEVVLNTHHVEHDEEVGNEENGDLAVKYKAALARHVIRLNKVLQGDLPNCDEPDEGDLPDECVVRPIENNPGKVHAPE